MKVTQYPSIYKWNIFAFYLLNYTKYIDYTQENYA